MSAARPARGAPWSFDIATAGGTAAGSGTATAGGTAAGSGTATAGGTAVGSGTAAGSGTAVAVTHARTSAHDRAPATAARAVTPEPALITAVGLRKAYGATTALDDASLDVTAGEIVAVTGASGSGKSTLLHCAAGIVTPDAGEVSHRGVPLSSMSDARRSDLRRDRFGFVFQFGRLVPELTALENVALPLRLRGEPRRAARALAAEWLDRVGAAAVAGARPGGMSGGQGQRVALARALVTGPEIVFADEPTGALDSLAGEKLMRLLVDTARHTGAAVVVVTHDARVAAYAEREVVVRDGRTRVTRSPR